LVEPLHNTSYEISLTPHRAVAGFVFIDKDRDGVYSYGKDEPVQGASVSCRDRAAVSDISGAYILRDLPAGRIELSVSVPNQVLGTSFFIELGAQPVTKRGVDIALNVR
jgi:hypothetical protein